MNMTNVLHRRSAPTVTTRPSTSPPNSVPPPGQPPDEIDRRPTPWPTDAKVWVAILVVATVIGAVGIAAALTSGGEASADRQLQDRITTLTQERDAAEERVVTLTEERDDALMTLDEIDAELLNLRERLQTAEDGSDELEVQIATLTAQRAEALATVDSLEATIGGLESSVAELESRVELLDAALLTANRRVADAVAERDALAKLFPIEFDASLIDGAMAGTYDVALKQIHCSGLGSCGTLPAVKELTITRTANGVLLVTIPEYVDGGLSRTGGALHMVAHSTTAIPACAGVARTAEITMTLFPGAYEIGDDGVPSVVAVGGVLTVESPAVGGCPAALAFYSVDLNRA